VLCSVEIATSCVQEGSSSSMAVWPFLRNVVRYARTVHGANGPRCVSTRSQPFPIFVINLERSEHRRAFILNHLSQLGFSAAIFPAVDGRALDIAELERSGIYREAVAQQKFSRSLSPAEIACTLSHLRLHEKIVREDIDTAIVLEDDAMFVDDIDQRLAALLGSVPPDWDLVQLIYSCQDCEAASDAVVRFRMRTSMPVASAGYVIRKSGAQKMVNNGYPVRYPADSLIGRSPRWGTNVYGARPQLVTINNVFPSGIYSGRGWKSRVSTKAKEALMRFLGA
jgi:glycosyl transferase, family 25